MLSPDREPRERNADRANPKQTAMEVWGKRAEPNFMSEINNELEQEPCGGGGRPQRERSGDSIAPLGKSDQGGGEGVVVDPTIISLLLRFPPREV